MARWRGNPVFFYECVAGARRWQTYAVRTAFVAVLFVSLLWVWWFRFPHDPRGLTRNELASIGASFFLTFVSTQFALVLLAAPAYTAGAVCMDRARGTLTHMLVTDLSAAEIVLGKLGSRLLPILGLVLVGLPILTLTMLLGGIDPEAVAGSFIVTIGVAVVGCTLALALSVWGNQPYEALLATWFALALALLPLPVWYLLRPGWQSRKPPQWLEKINPFWLAFAPYLEPDRFTFADYLVFLGGAIGLSACFTLFAVLTLRRAASRSPTRSSRKPWLPIDAGFSLGWPSLDFNPVLWREWHRQRPSRWMRVVWAIYFFLSMAASAFVLSVDGWLRGDLAAFVNGFVFSIGLLLVSVTSVSSLFEERVRGSLDVLLTTPLSTASILVGKWWGSFRTVVHVSLLPAGLAFCLAFEKGQQGAVLLMFGLLVLGYGILPFLAALLHRVDVVPVVKLTAFCLFVYVALTLLLESHPPAQTLGLLTVMIPLMLAYGALVNSLGLAIATRVQRFGVAIGLSVAVYLLLTAGTLLLLIAAGPSGEARGFACVSPWFGIAYTTALIAERDLRMRDDIGWMFLWTIIDGAVAVAVVALTRSIFDRCLGRIEGWWVTPVNPTSGARVE